MHKNVARLAVLILLAALLLAGPFMAQAEHRGGGEANLVLPDLDQATFLGGIGGRTLLMAGLVVSALGLLFGLVIFMRLRNLPVHTAMREVSELIYETCKTYLVTQGKFLMLLEGLIARHHRLLLRLPAGHSRRSRCSSSCCSA